MNQVKQEICNEKRDWWVEFERMRKRRLKSECGWKSEMEREGESEVSVGERNRRRDRRTS